MMGGAFGNAGVFLVKVVFGLYILVVLLRLLLQMVRADFYNPISQFIVKATNPPLIPLRRIIPGLGGIDLASVVLLLALQVAELALIGLIAGMGFYLPALLVLSAGELLSLLIDVFFFAILIQAILSWINPSAYNPFTALLYSLTEPLLRPARRLLPPISGIDLSPLLALIGLQLCNILLVAPLRHLGQGLLMG